MHILSLLQHLNLTFKLSTVKEAEAFFLKFEACLQAFLLLLFLLQTITDRMIVKLDPFLAVILVWAFNASQHTH